MTNLKLNTIEGVTSAINALLGTKQADKPSPMMLAAFDGVLALIEKRGKSQQINETVAKVRLALGMTPQATEEKINAPA
jgi:hypothetical protein